MSSCLEAGLRPQDKDAYLVTATVEESKDAVGHCSALSKVLYNNYAMRQNGVKRFDSLSPSERSLRMSKVRSKNNRSTEMLVAAKLRELRIRGWRRHVSSVPGRPDFYFAAERIAVFVDGCFWHGCPYCCRNTPRTRQEFWKRKIESNKRRDREVNSLLRKQNYTVIRIWEHALNESRWSARLKSLLRRREPISTLVPKGH